MKIAISAESTIDLPKDILKEFDIHTLPFSVLLGEKSGKDGEITPEEIFAYVDETGKLPQTAAVNEYEFEEHFSSLLKDYDAVIHLSLSSELSSAYAHAVSASEKLKNVFVIDTRALSTGIAVLALKAREFANQGIEPSEIVAMIKELIPKLQISFVVNKLNYLAKGGRCSAAAAFGANLLKIKPRIVMKDGKMNSDKKYRGKNNIVIEQYCRDTLLENKDFDKSVVFLTHSSASPEMIESANEALKKAGFERIINTVAGSTITSHCGPKALGILYLKK